jgi:hypothetical protein
MPEDTTRSPITSGAGRPTFTERTRARVRSID